MDKLEEIKLRDAGCNLECPSPTNWPQYYRGSEDRRWLLAEVERWRFGYTEASNDRDRERDKWIAAEREVERLRAALQSIENFTISPYHPAILARRALAGEEE